MGEQIDHRRDWMVVRVKPFDLVAFSPVLGQAQTLALFLVVTEAASRLNASYL